MEPEIRDDRQMRALTGVSIEKLEILEAAFAKAFAEEKERIYQEKLSKGQRASANPVEAKKANYRPYAKS